ncbi:hypothetical protein [Salmonella phage SS9]|uniref:Uncharacterized protein n=2 Tax=Kuttervirus SS9 TaxID=2846107 RepID=A0A5C0CDZ0_9CAUD|nr:hypothetical protein HYP88_gp119 [Salmonella phage SS9]EDL7894863.1 hypothetical protein [Salmonella enterica subsp. enterica serovar Typhimurium]QEI24031.1 hypothetical protein [Salmonella phage SS3]QEI24284.1 hypothetical protein [Salmonella phage SS9]
MGRPIIHASEGAIWVMTRIPNVHFPQFQEEIEQAMLTILEKYGYDTEVRESFNEIMPVVVAR